MQLETIKQLNNELDKLIAKGKPKPKKYCKHKKNSREYNSCGMCIHINGGCSIPGWKKMFIDDERVNRDCQGVPFWPTVEEIMLYEIKIKIGRFFSMQPWKLNGWFSEFKLITEENRKKTDKITESLQESGELQYLFEENRPPSEKDIDVRIKTTEEKIINKLSRIVEKEKADQKADQFSTHNQSSKLSQDRQALSACTG